MITLATILQRVKTISIIGNIENSSVDQIQFDSRKVVANTLFIAIKGTVSDGHQYIDSCIEKDCTAIVCEILPEKIVPNVIYIKVADTAKALGLIASSFYGNPSSDLKLVAITGTNGKTTTVTLFYNLLRSMGKKVGMLSTVKNQINDEVYPATHTTPDAIQLNQMLAKMVESGCEYCFVEASSHAIVQERISGLSLTGAIFSNITHDHLDYHQTFDNYIAAKKKLFDELPSSAFALTNIDDKRGMVMLQNTAATKHTFSLRSIAEFKGKLIGNTLQGLEMEIDNQNVWFKLIGEFNAYNLLGVYAGAVLLGLDQYEVLTHLSNIIGAKGRFETVISKNGIIGIVDYAHTPDAVENVLKTIKELRTGNEQVITVIGCGGDRDNAKRPIMAKIACHYSNKVILTADNPRSEDPESILDQMQAGVSPVDFKKVSRITDRKAAIEKAISDSGPGDIILIAGKGHEDYQEIKGIKYHFDDHEELLKAYQSNEKS